VTILNIVGFLAGLFFFYLGYIAGPLQWQMARKALRAIDSELGPGDVDPTELENMRRYALSTPFLSPLSIVFFVVAVVSCFPLVRSLLQ